MADSVNLFSEMKQNSFLWYYQAISKAFKSFSAIIGLPGGKKSQTNRQIEVDVNVSDLKEEIFEILKHLAIDNGFMAYGVEIRPNRLIISVTHQREEFAEHILKILQDRQIVRHKILCLVAEDKDTELYSPPTVEVQSFLPEAEKEQSVTE